MANLIYNQFAEYMGDGTIDMDNDTFKCCLLTSTHTPAATDTIYANLDNEVANGNGYTTAGETLTTVTWSESGGTIKFDADDVQWTSATFTCRYAVIYSDTAAADQLVCLFDFTDNQTVTAGTFTISFHASGIIDIS